MTTPAAPSTPPGSTAPVVATVRIAAEPHVVFPYFTDPVLATKWIADSAELDPRAGGVFHVVVQGNPARGVFVEVDPPRRVVFTWGIDGNENLPPGTTTVEVDLVAEGDETVVTLTHRDLPEDFRASHQGGWNEFIAKLGSVAATRPKG